MTGVQSSIFKVGVEQFFTFVAIEQRLRRCLLVVLSAVGDLQPTDALVSLLIVQILKLFFLLKRRRSGVSTDLENDRDSTESCIIYECHHDSCCSHNPFVVAVLATLYTISIDGMPSSRSVTCVRTNRIFRSGGSFRKTKGFAAAQLPS